MAGTTSIKSISDAIKALETLDKKLGSTKLKNLRPFNIAYLIISKNVNSKIEQNEFKYPLLLKELDVDFVKYYLDAIENFNKGKPIPKAWEIAFGFCQKNNNPLFCLALGANAHINNDLPFCLQDIIKNKDFHSDFQKVEEIIDESLDEILHSITKSKFIWHYKIVIRFLIKRWRKNVWKNYLKLKKGEMTREEIQIHAGSLANKIVLNITFSRN